MRTLQERLEHYQGLRAISQEEERVWRCRSNVAFFSAIAVALIALALSSMGVTTNAWLGVSVGCMLYVFAVYSAGREHQAFLMTLSNLKDVRE